MNNPRVAGFSRLFPTVSVATVCALALVVTGGCDVPGADADAGPDAELGRAEGGAADATVTYPDAGGVIVVADAGSDASDLALDASDTEASAMEADASAMDADAPAVDAGSDSGSDSGSDAGSDAGVPLTCPGDQQICAGACTATLVDGTNCGTCGNVCAPGTACMAGSCETDCSANLLMCGSSCVDVQDDPRHCGGCDTACSIPNGTNVCVAGACALLACEQGFNQCPPAWMELPVTACAALDSDAQNCGWCGHVCALANASSTCAAHQCALSACNPGFLDCDADPSDGCEVQGATCPAMKIAFITSTTYAANLGGYAGADARCAAAASAAHLAGTFFAWVSDGATTPASRFSKSTVPYALVDGTIVANDFAGLTSGNLRHEINLTETGGPAPAATVGGLCNAWTGTSTAGNAQNGTCSSWSSTSDSGCAGNSSLKNPGWSCQCSGAICGGTAALFCMQQ